jgi:hypothetical protein
LFVAKFQTFLNSGAEMVNPTAIVPLEDWLSGLRMGDQVTGPALVRVLSDLPQGIRTVPEEFWQPSAFAVGRVGWKSYQAGQRDDVWRLVPHYYRLSAAEEKLGNAARNFHTS